MYSNIRFVLFKLTLFSNYECTRHLLKIKKLITSLAINQCLGVSAFHISSIFSSFPPHFTPFWLQNEKKRDQM